MPYTSGVGSGGLPAPPPALGYRHQQATPSRVWVIAHGLGFRPAGVLVSDPDGNPVEGVVTHPDLTTTHITFGVPMNGTADLS